MGNQLVLLIKSDANGDTLWTKKRIEFESNSYSVQSTKDNGYIVTGRTYSDDDIDLFLSKTDAFGDTLWTKVLGGEKYDAGYSVQPTKDGGFIITGFTESFGNGDSDLWLLKTDGYGYILWTKSLGSNTDDAGYSVRQTSDNGYVVLGRSGSFGNCWLVRIAEDVASVDENNQTPAKDFNLKQNYPNPFNQVTMIHYQLPMTSDVELSIYNVLGQKVATLVDEKLDAGYHQVEWDATGFASGVYNYRMEAGNYVETRKMFYLK
jgi:hypothetical protein